MTGKQAAVTLHRPFEIPWTGATHEFFGLVADRNRSSRETGDHPVFDELFEGLTAKARDHVLAVLDEDVLVADVEDSPDATVPEHRLARSNGERP